MNARDLAARLDRRFQVLAGGRRGKIERHQTLRAVIDWSYDLLSKPEQRLLARVTVFSGGWTLDAAEAVGAGGPIDADDVFELTERLVGCSLVIAEDLGFQTRYRLLETIREYGEDRLAEHAETDEYRLRHAEFYCEFVELTTAQMYSSEQGEVGRRFVVENENVLTAINFAIDTNSVDLALRLTVGVPFPLQQTGIELRPPAERVANLTGAAEHPLYPRCLGLAAFHAAQRGDRAGAENMRSDALAAAARLGDPTGWVAQGAAGTLAVLAYGRGATGEAADRAEEAVEIARANGRGEGLAVMLAAAATYRAMAGEPARSRVLATEGLARARQLEAPSFVALNLVGLAAALADEDPERASALLRESVELRTRLGVDTPGLVSQAVIVSARIGDWPQTLTLASPAIRGQLWSGDRPLLAATLNIVARALASTNAEGAATLQGAARRLAVAEHRSPPANGEPSPHGQPSAPMSATDFITTLRRTTTALLVEQLGDAGLRDRRTQGEAMDDNHAVTFALAAIEREQRRAAENNDIA